MIINFLPLDIFNHMHAGYYTACDWLCWKKDNLKSRKELWELSQNEYGGDGGLESGFVM